MVVESSEWLQRTGHVVAVACWDDGPREVSCPVYALPATDSVSAMGAAMQDVVRQFSPDIVQLHLTENDYFLAEVGRLAPTCRFLHDQAWFCSGGDRMAGDYTACHRPHGFGCLFWHYAQRCGGKDPRGNWSRWRLVEKKQSLKQAACIRIQVASEFMRRGLIENGYDSKRIDVVPLFARGADKSAAMEPGLVLAACRLVKSKGMDYLIGALAQIKDVRWRLAVAGEGPERGQLQARVDELGVAGQVQFLSELSPLALDDWYARAQIVASPTLRQEPFGLVGLEAMAHGKPVVAYAGGATEEWLVDGETGIVVRERTASALAVALARLLNDGEMAKRCGEKARLRWARFTPEQYVHKVSASFQQCIDEFRQYQPPPG